MFDYKQPCSRQQLYVLSWTKHDHQTVSGIIKTTNHPVDFIRNTRSGLHALCVCRNFLSILATHCVTPHLRKDTVISPEREKHERHVDCLLWSQENFRFF